MVDSFHGSESISIAVFFKSGTLVAAAAQSVSYAWKAVIDRAKLRGFLFCILPYLLHVKSGAQFSVLR